MTSLPTSAAASKPPPPPASMTITIPTIPYNHKKKKDASEDQHQTHHYKNWLAQAHIEKADYYKLTPVERRQLRIRFEQEHTTTSARNTAALPPAAAAAAAAISATSKKHQRLPLHKTKKNINNDEEKRKDPDGIESDGATDDDQTASDEPQKKKARTRTTTPVAQKKNKKKRTKTTKPVISSGMNMTLAEAITMAANQTQHQTTTVSTAQPQTRSVFTDLDEESVLAAQRDGGGGDGGYCDDTSEEDDDDEDNVPIAYNASIAAARRCRPFQQQQQHRKQPPPSSKKKKKKKTSTLSTQATQTCPSWEMMFYQLVLYKLSHNGSCLVDLDNNNNDDDDDEVGNNYAHLSTWVEEQRQLYMNGAIEKDRIAALSSLEFVWEIMQKRKNPAGDSTWEDKFQQWKEYLETHTTGEYPPNRTPLGAWANSQRLAYKAYEKSLAQYRQKYPNQPIVKPEDLMIVRKRRKSDTKVAEEHAHETKLGLVHRYGPNLITQERIDKLRSIGFQWRLSPEWTSFEDRLQELRSYRDLHGNCCVPQHYSENKQLGKWVTKQRYQYNLKQQGKKNQMTDDRIKQLANIGFEFTSRVHKKQQTAKVATAIETATPEPDNNVHTTYEDMSKQFI